MPISKTQQYFKTSGATLSRAAPMLASIQNKNSDNEQQQITREYRSQTTRLDAAIERVSTAALDNNNVLIQSEQELIKVNETLEKILHATDSKDDGIPNLTDLIPEKPRRARPRTRSRAKPGPRPRPRAGTSGLQRLKQRVSGTLGRVLEKGKSIATSIGRSATSLVSPKQVLKGAATTAAAGTFIEKLTGREDTMSALGIGLSTTATGVLGVVAGAKSAFELSEKYGPGPSVRRLGPQDINSNTQVELLKDIGDIKAGTLIAARKLIVDELEYPENQFLEIAKQLHDGGYIKIAEQQTTPVSQQNPMLRPISFAQRMESRPSTSTGEYDYNSLIFDADTIAIMTDNFIGPAGMSGQPGAPGTTGMRTISTAGAQSAPGQMTPGAAATQVRAGMISDMTPGGETSEVYDFGAAAVSQTASESIVGARAPGSSGTGSAEEVMNFFVNKGYTKEQAAGIAANIKYESDFKTDAVGDSGKAYGLAQWHPDRQANFSRVFGKDIKQSTFQEQLEFINWELSGSESRARRALMGARTPEEAAMLFDKFYERSSGTTTAKRMELALNYARSAGPQMQQEQRVGGQVINEQSMAARPRRTPISVTVPQPAAQAGRQYQAMASQDDRSAEIPLSQLISSLA